MTRWKTLSGLVNSCLADWIAQHSRREIETRLADEYRQGRASFSRAWLADLPKDVAERIAWKNAEALFVRAAPR